MTLFSAARTARRDDAELGRGVWRRAHDRFRRGLDRYHQILEGIEGDALYSSLAEVANQLAALLPRVRAVCVRAHALAPSDGLDVPGSLLAVHRALSKAGNALATTAEAAAMARLEPEASARGSAALENVRRRARQLADDVTSAEELLG